jgi:hypothetical protein
MKGQKLKGRISVRLRVNILRGIEIIIEISKTTIQPSTEPEPMVRATVAVDNHNQV